MNHQVISVWGEPNMANIETYLLKDSSEFNQGKKKPAIIVCPGGAYLGTSDREAEPVALRFNTMGYHAIVLRYNTLFYQFTNPFENFDAIEKNPNSLWPNPLLDLGKTISMLRERADEWFIDTDKIAICGFSAGGNLVGHLATRWDDPELSKLLGVSSDLLKPAGAIMGYPVVDYKLMRDLGEIRKDVMGGKIFELCNMSSFGVKKLNDEQLAAISPITAVSENTVPCFLWHTASDPLVYVENSLDFARKLSANQIPFALHVFPNGPHGLSLADQTTAYESELINPDVAIWIDLVRNWLRNLFA